MNEHPKSLNGTDRAASGDAAPPIDPPSVATLFAAGVVLLLAAYTAVFALTLNVSAGEALRTALANVVPLAFLAAASWWGLRRWILRLSVVGQTAAHVLLAPAFAMLWYASTLLLLSMDDWLSDAPFAIGRFVGLAFTWQMFQGVVLYALVAAVTYALRGGRLATNVTIVERSAPLERYFTRSGDELQPVAVGDIVSIRGAQDYAEVRLLDGRTHLIRMALGELEGRLPASDFLRVHRSTIINLAHVVRVEPIGSGRMMVHLPGGAVEASRSGAQLLRQQVL